MNSTTIRLDDDLKLRVSASAEKAGKTVHAFILDAISEAVEQAELDEASHCIAEERWSNLLSTGASVGWDDARAYLEARARGERPRKPRARKLAS